MARTVWWSLSGLALLGSLGIALAQETAPVPQPRPAAFPVKPAGSLDVAGNPLPINLPSALQLANARGLDIAVASERLRVAAAQLEHANTLWLPTILLGTDYGRHDGKIQDTAGNVTDSSKSNFLLGAGPSAVFAVSDAIFAPLSARQVVQARQAGVQVATNDTLLSVAEAYFTVQQARGELAGAGEAVRLAEELVRRTQQVYDQGRAPQVEVARVRGELARRRQAVHLARERWRVASADLIRILRLDASALVDPVEPPHLQVTLVALDRPVDELIPVGLTNRPELAAQQALVRATLEQLRQERIRPLVPSILLRGASTNVTGTLAGGYFGGGRNDNLNQFGARGDFDLQVLWELQNLGFGNRARVNERRAEHELALLESLRVQDRVAAEVARAYAQGQEAAARVGDARTEVGDAIASVNGNLSGVKEVKRVGNLDILVIRPQEVVAAIEALAQAYNDYYGAVADFNRAQFRLYHAMGQPAQVILNGGLLACQTGRTQR
jgi:outer membrane protein TolC